MSLMSPALASEFFTTSATWEAHDTWLLSQKNRAGMVAQSVVKNPPVGHEEPLEKEMSHSTILAWKIPWTEEPGGLQSMGAQEGRHYQATECAARELV